MKQLSNTNTFFSFPIHGKMKDYFLETHEQEDKKCQVENVAIDSRKHCPCFLKNFEKEKQMGLFHVNKGIWIGFL